MAPSFKYNGFPSARWRCAALTITERSLNASESARHLIRKIILGYTANFISTRGVGPAEKTLSLANLHTGRGKLCMPPLPFGKPTPNNYRLPETNW